MELKEQNSVSFYIQTYKEVLQMRKFKITCIYSAYHDCIAQGLRGQLANANAPHTANSILVRSK